MSRADRTNLERLARKRAKVTKSMIGERVKVLRSDVEDQLSSEYKIDDAIWADITRQAQVTVAKADAEIAAICRRTGVPENLRPSLGLGWNNRGENALASRRTELRKLAHARIDAAAESAKVTIEARLLDVETELIRDGLESAEAVALVASMPTPDELLPPVDVGELEPGVQPSKWDSDEMRGRYGGWTRHWKRPTSCSPPAAPPAARRSARRSLRRWPRIPIGRTVRSAGWSASTTRRWGSCAVTVVKSLADAGKSPARVTPLKVICGARRVHRRRLDARRAAGRAGR